MGENLDDLGLDADADDFRYNIHEGNNQQAVFCVTSYS